MILFCVIRDLYPNINQNINVNKDTTAITINTIKKFICDTDDRKRLKLLTHPSHQNDFEECVLNEGAAGETQLKNNKDSVKDKFIEVSDIFKEKLSEIGEEETGKFLNYIGYCVKMIKITCREKSFAVKLFQILNSRGKDLKSSDLIKSALISKLPDSKHKQFIADWDKANNIIENFDCGTDIDEMFTFYVYYNRALNPKRNNYEEIERISEKNKDSNEFINDFKSFCLLYSEHISKSNNKVINSLWYLGWQSHWKAVLITALKLNFPDYKELAFELRRFYYLNWIAGKTVNTIKQTSFNVIKFIKKGRPLSFIKEELNKKLEADNIFQLALFNLKSNSAKASWIKPVLMMIEYHQTDEENKDFIPLSRKTHLEHVLPVQYKKISGWEHIEEDTEDNYLNSIGNLTLLGGSKNVEAGNNSFEDKLNIYKGSGKYNDSKKGMTSFLITQKIAQDVNAGNIKKWDRTAMENRWNWFLNEIKDLLQIDVSSIFINEKNKIEDINNKTLINPKKKTENIDSNIKKLDQGRLFEKETKKQERKRKNKEFFNNFLEEMEREHPDIYLRHSNSNAIHATLSKFFGKITIFREAGNHHRVGIFWKVRKDEDHKLFELMKKDVNFPKNFKMEEISDDRYFVEDLPFDDIYDSSTYSKQVEFLKTNLVLIYNYMNKKISEFEKNLNPKAS